MMSTAKLYAPGLVNVTVTCLLPLVSFEENDAGATPNVCRQWYLSASSPSITSSPSTVRFAVLPVTGLGVACGGKAMVGGALAPKTEKSTPVSTSPPATVTIRLFGVKT